MSDITVIEKPENVSYQKIKEILIAAHQQNFEKGIVLHTTELSPEELEKRVGKNGKTFIALDNGKIVGTASYRIREQHKWYVNGNVVDEILVGVIPESKGKHVYSHLYDCIEKEAIEGGYDQIIFSTAEKNINKQQIGLKKGFYYVNYFVAEDNDHYSVIMSKWLNGCPFSKQKLRRKYLLKKGYIKLRYKPRKIKRFGI